MGAVRNLWLGMIYIFLPQYTSPYLKCYCLFCILYPNYSSQDHMTWCFLFVPKLLLPRLFDPIYYCLHNWLLSRPFDLIFVLCTQITPFKTIWPNFIIVYPIDSFQDHMPDFCILYPIDSFQDHITWFYHCVHNWLLSRHMTWFLYCVPNLLHSIPFDLIYHCVPNGLLSRS